MIASVHIADVGPLAALGVLRARPRPRSVEGLRYAEVASAAPLSARLLPIPSPGRVALIAAWEDDLTLDRFLAGHELAAPFAAGWHVRLQPTRIVGRWSELPELALPEQAMDEEEPAAVLTLGRLRLRNALRFLRASAAAEELALREPALLAASGLARPPRLVATFSLWRTTRAMQRYARGASEPPHAAVVRAHAAKPFHHESAFVRFRPYGASGSWDGREPLAGAVASGERTPVGAGTG